MRERRCRRARSASIAVALACAACPAEPQRDDGVCTDPSPQRPAIELAFENVEIFPGTELVDVQMDVSAASGHAFTATDETGRSIRWSLPQELGDIALPIDGDRVFVDAVLAEPGKGCCLEERARASDSAGVLWIAGGTGDDLFELGDSLATCVDVADDPACNGSRTQHEVRFETDAEITIAPQEIAATSLGGAPYTAFVEDAETFDCGPCSADCGGSFFHAALVRAPD